jgi:hypothetical protein
VPPVATVGRWPCHRCRDRWPCRAIDAAIIGSRDRWPEASATGTACDRVPCRASRNRWPLPIQSATVCQLAGSCRRASRRHRCRDRVPPLAVPCIDPAGSWQGFRRPCAATVGRKSQPLAVPVRDRWPVPVRDRWPVPVATVGRKWQPSAIVGHAVPVAAVPVGRDLSGDRLPVAAVPCHRCRDRVPRPIRRPCRRAIDAAGSSEAATVCQSPPLAGSRHRAAVGHAVPSMPRPLPPDRGNRWRPCRRKRPRPLPPCQSPPSMPQGFRLASRRRWPCRRWPRPIRQPSASRNRWPCHR